ncbi:carbohydrate kinase family protein [uncultured Methanobrevibacter sp.]|uniref:carbohydrate kinase family protein n=1 Tax=uncultured Methanobrevibacter sp. TaxID=253161 RepID=UPI00261FF0DB|nr:carbohydrate kinase family protein [uncultured Methanobrevibacter sp.]
MEFLDSDINVEVIGFGALNVDKLHTVENIACNDEESFIKSQKNTPGGSAANTVIGLARLGCPSSIIGKIAEDDDGDLIELNLAKNGVYTNNLIYADEGNTGKVLGFVDTKGERCLYVDPGVNDDIALNEINLLNLTKCKIIHYTSFVGDSFKTQIELLDKINDNILLSFDPGMLYVQKGLNELKPILDKTDILLINEIELRLLYEEYYKIMDCVDSLSIKEIAIHILDEGIKTVVVKKGSEGVFAINSNEECDVATYECDVVDTTGAGDSFNSGFLYGMLNDYSLEESCKLGNWVASRAIEGFGMEKFPNLKDLNEFIN